MHWFTYIIRTIFNMGDKMSMGQNFKQADVVIYFILQIIFPLFNFLLHYFNLCILLLTM